MTTAKKIECPACGAASVFKINATEYKCNYCQVNFIPGEEETKPVSNSFFEHTTNTHGRHVTIIRDPRKAKIAGVILFSLIISFIAGIAGVIFYSASTIEKKNFGNNPDWQSPTLNKYIAFAGSKGPVVWEILEYTGTKLDSARHELLILDPKTQNVISEIPFGKTTTWKENFNFYNALSHEFLVLNDTLYNGSEGGGLQAFDLYTGQRLLSNLDFEQRFPELKEGISKVDSRLYNNLYVLNTNAGNEFYYYPQRNLLRTKKEEDNSYKTDTATRKNFYLSEGKKPFLYLITQKEGPNTAAVVYNTYLEGFSKGDHYYKKQFRSLEKIGDKVYPCAQRLITNPDFVVLAYLSDFSKKPVTIIEKIDASGKSLWQNRDTALAALISNFSVDNLHLNYNASKTEIVLYNSSSINRSLGIDLSTGITTFVNTQSYNLD
ncbi:MAG: hypothetical protein H0W61_11135 [Bacteroidetes bacterium]|nr:hypothetical protein [Bacteroidota bacterium]